MPPGPCTITAASWLIPNLDVDRYHAINVALHVANALLVFALGRALFRRAGASARVALSDEAAPWAALAGAALFAASPLQVEAVMWIAQRGSLLAALGSLAAALCYLRARDPGRPARAVWWTATAVCWLVSLGSREAAVALPVAIGLCEWLVGNPTRAFPRRLSIAIGLCIAAAVLWITVRNASALALYESLVVFPAPARLSLVHDVGGSPLAYDLSYGPAARAFACAASKRFQV